MRLEKFININEKTEEEHLNSFLSETTEYRKMMKGVRLWRAHNHKLKGIQKFYQRHDRIPKDTPKEIHDWLDDWFNKNFGFRARSDAVFASSTPGYLDYYGKYTDLIYPCNGFKFVYSNIIRDLTIWLKETGYVKSKDSRLYAEQKFKNSDNRKELEKILKQSYTNKDLPAASLSPTEVALYCPNGFYMIGGGDFFEKHYNEIIGDYK